jgi:hypothetical protein
MKKNCVTSLLLIVAIAGITSIVFYSCKKNINHGEGSINVQKNMDVSFADIDFEKIGRQNGMLAFESWEHYIGVIEALQDVCIAYTQKHINNLIAENGGVEDENYIDEKLEAENFSQFAPVHDFCAILQFNSLYQKLEPLEIKWKKTTDATEKENPFIVNSMGCYQSALHNANGFVVIAGETYGTEYFKSSSSGSSSIDQKAATATCRNESRRWDEPYKYDGKYKRVLHSHCWTNQSFTRSFNNTWKINTKNGRRSDWWPAHEINVSGKKI